MPLSKNSRLAPKRKPPAKKRWTDALSKRSAISAIRANEAPALPKKPTKRADPALVLERLRKHYPDAHCELTHRNPFELLVATVLSAQCTDVMVNRVTPALFEAYPTPAALAAADPSDVELKIATLGLFRMKAKSIRSLAGDLVGKHRGEVPRELEKLVELAGVGRKTANVVLGNAFGVTSGIVVDTHVGRLSRRFGWTSKDDAIGVENDLQKIIPKDRWIQVSHELIFHGRRVCKALRPDCASCFLLDVCPRRGVQSQSRSS